MKACPVGWHLPTRAEWEALQDEQNSTGVELKADGNSGVNFTYDGTGRQDGSFNGKGEFGAYWLDWKDGLGSPVAIYFGRKDDYVMDPQPYFPDFRYSVRCVCNASAPLQQRQVSVTPASFLGYWNGGANTIEGTKAGTEYIVSYYPGNYNVPDPLQVRCTFSEGVLKNTKLGIVYRFKSSNTLVSERLANAAPSTNDDGPDDAGVEYTR